MSQPPVTGTVRVTAAALRGYAAAVLAAAGMTDEDAAIAAEAMAWSDLRGELTHGTAHRVPQAVERIQAGGANPRPHCRAIAQSPSFTLLDGNGGWGQVVGTRAMRIA